MTLSEYQKLAQRTINLALSWKEIELHALHGLASEIGEIHGIYQKAYQGHQMVVGDIAEEIGDVLWMIAELCTALGLEMDEIAEENIEKLKKRYPDGFEEKRSINR